jgi:hypothetical protein
MPVRIALILLALVWPVSVAAQQQDFDRPGSPYVATQCVAPPAPEVVAGGPSGSFLRLGTSTIPNQNSIAFDGGVSVGGELVVADFDMRIVPTPPGRADGVAFALLDTGVYGQSGPACPHVAAEEPNFTRSLGIGFDVFRNDEYGDIGDDVVRPFHTNSISVHYDGRVLSQTDVSAAVDLACGLWIHVRVVVEPDDGYSCVSVVLTPYGGAPVTVVSQRVTGLVPYEARAAFASRSGGQTSQFDLDNIRVVELGAAESAVSFASPWAFVDERAGRAVVAVTRTGDVSVPATVRYTTEPDTAAERADYRRRSGTLRFAAGEATRFVRVALRDDGSREPEETFRVRLEQVSGDAEVAGPESVVVTIYDDEQAAVRGRWEAPRWWPILAVHGALLPSGEVLFWDRLGENRLWDPAADAIGHPGHPPFDVFCAGHAFLPDGRLLVAGGHEHGGHPEFDGVGVPDAAIYDPATDTWIEAPDMNAGRWYPTTTTLANGDVLVSSGSVDTAFTPNYISQVWLAGEGAWRDLTGAQEHEPYGTDLYPRMFLAPDGRVFKAGPDRDSWFLDVEGLGAWSRGPLANFERPRTYGPAAMYAPGKILVAGGANPPTETAEVIDLNDAAPAWRPVAPMAFARRHANLTLLPDGTALVTGGSSGPGFNDQTMPVFAAELWDPATERWTQQAAARAPRTYHSLALLLPDGRVLATGGGQGGGASNSQTSAELFSPSYLFRGPRPAISEAPAEVSLGERFLVRSPDAAAVRRVTLVRLPSVTHAFDENQRFLELELSRSGAGLRVTAPARAADCPPGHYMLFVVNAAGVPSVARIVRVIGQG